MIVMSVRHLYSSNFAKINLIRKKRIRLDLSMGKRWSILMIKMCSFSYGILLDRRDSKPSRLLIINLPWAFCLSIASLTRVPSIPSRYGWGKLNSMPYKIFLSWSFPTRPTYRKNKWISINLGRYPKDMQLIS